MKVYTLASGDSRLSANQNCWAAQAEMESQLGEAIAALGHEVVRAHPFKEKEAHGFIAGQREGLDVFKGIPVDAPIIVAVAVWQYSYHVYPGLLTHQGPVLTLANWSGQWPGLVGLLNLNGSLTKAGRDFSTLWGEDFSDAGFREQLRVWLETGTLVHPTDHARPFSLETVSEKAKATAEALAEEIESEKVILGVFDEGCMGMYNAIVPDEQLHPLGFFKERLSQSALLAEMGTVSEGEAREVLDWILATGFTFDLGTDHATELTEAQVLLQCKMYIAACRMGDSFGCDAIGIQYQQGLKDMSPASDLVEGMLNNGERPPVKNLAGEIIKPEVPFTHFNEVDECAGIDGVLTERVHRALGQPSENTLHDIRWGDRDRSGTVEDYVWVFEISGAAPPAHHIEGYAGSKGERQPAMYFPSGGSSLKGVAKPGEIVWSRIYVEPEGISMDIGRATVVELPEEETQRRWDNTTSQWPIMHAVIHGVTRDQLMAKHQSNHIQVAYANSAKEADLCLETKAALATALGMRVNLCGC
ncbi:MAG: fucose isomerase [Verrucomicrobiales bacterium]|nr:fucose isomerase [Verrucomicrobiales bacterium]